MIAIVISFVLGAAAVIAGQRLRRRLRRPAFDFRAARLRNDLRARLGR